MSHSIAVALWAPGPAPAHNETAPERGCRGLSGEGVRGRFHVELSCPGGMTVRGRCAGGLWPGIVRAVGESAEGAAESALRCVTDTPRCFAEAREASS